jgi:hypothetical protein
MAALVRAFTKPVYGDTLTAREPSQTGIVSSETINTGGTVRGFSLSYQFRALV